MRAIFSTSKTCPARYYGHFSSYYWSCPVVATRLGTVIILCFYLCVIYSLMPPLLAQYSASHAFPLQRVLVMTTWTSFLHHTVGLTIIPNSCSSLLRLGCLLFSVLTPRLPPPSPRRLIVGVGCLAPATAL